MKWSFELVDFKASVGQGCSLSFFLKLKLPDIEFPEWVSLYPPLDDVEIGNRWKIEKDATLNFDSQLVDFKFNEFEQRFEQTCSGNLMKNQNHVFGKLDLPGLNQKRYTQTAILCSHLFLYQHKCFFHYQRATTSKVNPINNLKFEVYNSNQQTQMTHSIAAVSTKKAFCGHSKDCCKSETEFVADH